MKIEVIDLAGAEGACERCNVPLRVAGARKVRPTHQIASTEADTPAPPPTRAELRARVVQAIKALRDTHYAWVLTREGRRALFAAYKRGQRGEMLPLHHRLSLPLQMAHAHGCQARRADRLRGHGALRVLRAPWCKHNPGEGEG